VRLVANPGSPCADTTLAPFKIFAPVQVSFEHSGQACFDSHRFNFSVNTSAGPDATYRWDFGANTNLGRSSKVKEPQGLVYTEPGLFVVKLTVEDFGCEATYIDTLKLFPRPILNHIVPEISQCSPHAVLFRDSSIYFGSALHFWDFGDGNLSQQASPIHLYTEPGLYTVTHRIQTLDGCLDTIEEVFVDQIEIFPSPSGKLVIASGEVDLFNPMILVLTKTDSSARQVILLPNGQRVAAQDSLWYQAEEPGLNEFVLISTNAFGCIDSTFQSILVESPVTFHIPNSFKPKSKVGNEVFYFSATGVEQVKIKIFNRWGNLVFEGRDSKLFWNGRLQNNGAECPAGVYVYIVSAFDPKSGKTIEKNGSLNLLR
jgi:gliding motility-associated-like protein